LTRAAGTGYTRSVHIAILAVAAVLGASAPGEAVVTVSSLCPRAPGRADVAVGTRCGGTGQLVRADGRVAPVRLTWFRPAADSFTGLLEVGVGGSRVPLRLRGRFGSVENSAFVGEGVYGPRRLRASWIGAPDLRAPSGRLPIHLTIRLARFRLPPD
jgi:hypothetical protein